MRLRENLAAVRVCVASAPDRTSWVKHLPIPLRSSDRVAAHDELVDHLLKSGPDWFYVTATGSDGGRMGYASTHFRPRTPYSAADIGAFLLFDMHSSLGAWWSSHLWRASDFAEATCTSLAAWSVLPAAACSRALLEGVAAFVVEGEQLLAEWSEFKQQGVPNLGAVTAFRERFHKKLLQAQFGSRIGEHKGTRPPPVKRTNVMTLLEKFLKRGPSDVWTSYEWLCDAVHPSFGFQTAYVATQGVHNSGATFAADLARRTDKAPTKMPKVEPNVAWACSDAFIVSVDALLAEVPRMRWLIDDLGLTTGVASSALEGSVGRRVSTKISDDCPCGSGLRLGDCRHVWGTPAEPPSFFTRESAK